MTRPQRRWHLWLWLALAPLLAVALTLALASRPAPDDLTNEDIADLASEVVP
jgi:hypothetical protein